MKAIEKYKKVFGEISHLSDEVPWTTGVSNTVEALLWETHHILGVSKKEYWKTIVDWCCDDEVKDLPLQQKHKEIEKRLNRIMKQTEQTNRYDKAPKGICTAREALRRIKYFSEDYLNKEFDIFLSLSSDIYLDQLYQQYSDFESGGTWSTHGNSGIFGSSIELSSMYIDNVAYNKTENILVANELKLNGKKNPDQILKYCLLCNHLEEIGFVEDNVNYLLLFIGGKKERYYLESAIASEVKYCEKKGREYLMSDAVLSRSEKLNLCSITWIDIIDFNNKYLKTLTPHSQVERKLIEGFNVSLSEKSYMVAVPENL